MNRSCQASGTKIQGAESMKQKFCLALGTARLRLVYPPGATEAANPGSLTPGFAAARASGALWEVLEPMAVELLHATDPRF